MGTVYSGIVGQHVLPSIRAATQSLDIVSPYLSPEYAQLILSKARQGVTVRLVTSDSNGHRHQQALRMIGGATDGYIIGSRFWRYVALAIVFGMSGVMLHNYAGLVLLAFSLTAVLAGVAKTLRKRPASTLQLFVKIVPATQLVHVKLYIVDQQVVFAGSANLTYSGMNRNIERIEMKTVPSEVQTEIGVFSSIWGPQPAPVIPPARIPPIGQPRQPRDTPAVDNAVTREEAKTLERLYKDFRPAAPSQSAKIPRPVAPSVGPSAKATWQERLRSRLRRMFL